MVGKDAVILLSGGVDSATAAAIAKQKGFQLHALSFRYGQRHEQEVEAAKRVAGSLKVSAHLIIDFDLRAIGGLALFNVIEVSKGRRAGVIIPCITVTYVLV